MNLQISNLSFFQEKNRRKTLKSLGYEPGGGSEDHCNDHGAG